MGLPHGGDWFCKGFCYRKDEPMIGKMEQFLQAEASMLGSGFSFL
jgi:hypothetical protein